ncbi:MAG: ribosome biogenesis GTPase YlqF [Candidatus Phytoplasma asteris]|nr:MAG: ribosome biogenesis GTP-binding protein [Periwinkle leaf yellowing phytoplasma]WEX19871.1 MAG: ribosome biogenesis GTPase YlqF [Candidatus Phytoplasma asteris]
MKTFNWFPGHMKKTFDQIKNNLSLVDVVLVILDARIPLSSLNSQIFSLINQRQKPLLILLNKFSLTDPCKINNFIANYHKKQIPVLTIDAIKSPKLQEIYQKALTTIKAKNPLFKSRRIATQTPNIKAMIVGTPNVGKSTLINSFAQKKVLKTANLAGTTKRIQWIDIAKPNIQFLDTPGVLWHNFSDPRISLALALAGCFKDSILPLEKLGIHALCYLIKHYGTNLQKRFNLDQNDLSNPNLVDIIGQKRNIYTKNQKVDQSRVYQMLLQEIRQGNLGKLNFDLDVLSLFEKLF